MRFTIRMDKKGIAGFSILIFLLFFTAAFICLLPSEDVYAGESESMTSYGASWEETCTGGICTRTLYSGMIRYWNGTNYELIDPTWKGYGQDGYDYIMDKAPYVLYAKEHSNWGDGIKYCVDYEDNEKCLIYQSQDYSFRDMYGSQDYISSITDVAGNLEGNKITYPDAYINVDLEFQTFNEMLKENYIINSLPRQPDTYLTEPVTLDFGGYIKYGDLDLYVNDVLQTGNSFTTSEKIEFRHDGVTLFYLPKPKAYDSDGNKTDIQYEVKVQGQQIWFYVRTPFEWLNDTNRTYPVYVDPTIQLQDADSENLEDGGVPENTQAPCGSVEWSGSDDAHNTGFPGACIVIKFDGTSIPDAATITSTSFCLYYKSGDGTKASGTMSSCDNETWTEDDGEFPTCTNSNGQTTITEDGNWDCGDVVDAVNYIWSTLGHDNITLKYHDLGGSPGTTINYYSKEHSTASERPYLDITYVLDETLPYFHTNTTNTTKFYAGHATNFTINVTDDNALDSTSGWIFATNNSGNWTNGTYTPFVDTGLHLMGWNVTVLNDTIVPSFIEFKWYANDSSGNENVSSIRNVTTIVPAPTLSNLTEPVDPSTYLKGYIYYFNLTVCHPDGLAGLSAVTFEFGADNNTENITRTEAVNSTCAIFLGNATDQPVQSATAYKFYVNDTSDEHTSLGSTFTIDKDTPTITAKLNSTNDNYTMEFGIPTLGAQGNGINITAECSAAIATNISVNDTNYGNNYQNSLTGGTIVYALTSDFNDVGVGNVTLNFTASCGDHNNTLVNDVLFISIEDTTPPQWANLTSNTTNNTSIKSGTHINISFNSYDNYNGDGAFQWNETYDGSWTNNTATKEGVNPFNSHIIKTDGMAEGDFRVRVWVDDSTSNENATLIYHYQIDDSAPTIGSETDEADQNYDPVETLDFSAYVDDATGLEWVYFEINGTNFTSPTNTSGTFSQNIPMLPVRAHTWYWYANDTLGNVRKSTGGTITISKSTPTLASYPTTATITYGTPVSQYCTEDNPEISGCSMSRELGANPPTINITDLNDTTENLGGGIWYFNFSVEQTQNYTHASNAIQTITVNRNTTSSLDIFLNGTKNADESLTYPSDANVTGNISLESQNAFTLYQNGSTKGTQVGTVIEFNDNLPSQAFNFTVDYPENQNYTQTSQEYVLTYGKADTASNLFMEFNYTNSNKTAGHNSVIVNVTGYCNLVSNQDLTFNLYDNESLLGTGDPKTNITYQLPPGEYTYVFNTSGGVNYTSGSVTRYISVWNASETNITQNNTLNVVADNDYNVTWKVDVKLNNTAGFGGNIPYNYTIPDSFTPYSIDVKNSTGDSVIINISSNEINFTTENISKYSEKFMTIYWISMDTISDSENLVLYTSTEYEKDVTVSSTVEGYTTTLGTIKIEVPNTFDINYFDLVITKNESSTSYTITNDTIYYDYITVSDQDFSSAALYNVEITAKEGGVGGDIPDPPAPGGGGGGTTCGGLNATCDIDSDCCGGYMCIDKKCAIILESLPTNISFAVWPTRIEPDPRITAVNPGRTFKDVISITNLEEDPTIMLKPEWAFTCTGETPGCLADWCYIRPADNSTIEIISAASTRNYNLICKIPEYANTELNCTFDNMGCNIYSGALSIWPSGYDTSTAQAARITIPVTSNEPFLASVGNLLSSAGSLLDYNQAEKFFSNVWEILTTPFICFSKSCNKEGIPFIDIMDEPFQFSFIFIDGISILLCIEIVAVALIVVYILIKLKPWTH